MDKIKWATYIARSIAFACAGVLIYWACTIDIPVQEKEDFSYPIPNRYFLKGGDQSIDLVPVLVSNPVIGKYDGLTYFTGDFSADVNVDIVSNVCVQANFGNIRFKSVDSLNKGFILIRGGFLDTLTGEVTDIWQYIKDDFHPWGVPILGYPDSGSGPSGTMKPKTFDSYIENLPMKLGYNVFMIVVNASGMYPEFNLRNNTGYYGAYWWQNPVCGYMGDIYHPLACFNEYPDNKFLTPKVKAQLKNARF